MEKSKPKPKVIPKTQQNPIKSNTLKQSTPKPQVTTKSTTNNTINQKNSLINPKTLTSTQKISSQQQQKQPQENVLINQYFILVRHGERLDDISKVTDEERARTKVVTEFDIPLSEKGHQMAYQTGLFIKSKLMELQENDCIRHQEEQKDPIKSNGEWKIKVYSSPYLRCLQTAQHIIKGLNQTEEELKSIDQNVNNQIQLNKDDEEDLDDQSDNKFNQICQQLLSKPGFLELKIKELIVKEELSEVNMSKYNDNFKLEELAVNQANSLSEFQQEYGLNYSDILYDKNYKDSNVFQMIYPEPFELHYDRYLNFFKKIIDQDFSKSEGKRSTLQNSTNKSLQQSQQCKIVNEVVIMSSHGNSVPVFYELIDSQSRTTKFIIGIGYCCVSIYKRQMLNGQFLQSQYDKTTDHDTRQDKGYEQNCNDDIDKWEVVLYGDGQHVGTGTTELIDEVQYD
eukprot:403356204